MLQSAKLLESVIHTCYPVYMSTNKERNPMTEEELTNYELEIESLLNRIHSELKEITTLANTSEIQHLREMHYIGDSLRDFAINRSREIQDEICEKAGPEISNRRKI
tara:strand:+ start:146 stop:466 length:321 start_codon:yes stop_codon:yes gene_type:complete